MPNNTAMATLTAMWVNQKVGDATTKRVCRIALESVGRLHWANGMVAPAHLVPGNTLNTQNLGCVCYEAPVAFALMGYALSIHEANTFYALSQGENPNAALLNHIYGRLALNILRWQPGAGPIPPGAMVFHGDTVQPCRHVTMSVGNGNVVSCWGVGLAAAHIDGANGGRQSAASKVFYTQVEELLAKKLSPDTVVMPFRAFTDFANPFHRLHYTNGPFWDFWISP